MVPNNFKTVSKFALLLLVLTISASAKRTKKSRHLGYSEIVEKVPDNILTLKMPTLINSEKYNPIKSMKRTIKVTVDPIEENCKSQRFKDELSILRSKVKCKPRPVVVHLESTSSSTLIPNSVLVKRCEGTCSSSHKCIANKTRDEKFYVREIKNNIVHCTSVIVSEDVSCVCDCPQRATDCKYTQAYDKDRCKCVCKNEKEFEKCFEKRKKRSVYYWDEKECACLCTEKPCTTGTHWNGKLCRCVAQTQARIGS